MLKGIVVCGDAFVAGAVAGVIAYRDNEEVMNTVEDKFGPKLDKVSDKIRPMFRYVRRKLNQLRERATCN